jgi:hypothetical protein
MTSKIKNIIIFSTIALAFVLIYIFFIKSSSPQTNLESSPSVTLPNLDGSIPNTDIINANSIIAKDFLVLLSNVTSIKIDDAIFSDPAFNSLRDSSITLIPDGTEGRPNPFAQFGNDIIPPSINTLNPAPVTPGAPIPPITTAPLKP